MADPDPKEELSAEEQLRKMSAEDLPPLDSNIFGKPDPNAKPPEETAAALEELANDPDVKEITAEQAAELRKEMAGSDEDDSIATTNKLLRQLADSVDNLTTMLTEG